MDLLRATIERTLGAQYDVLRLIGRGGMGAVYLARERLLERQVAVKVLPHDAAASEGGRERFLREARTAAHLSHPGIVPLHSFAEAEGTFMYVMGYVEGESLETRLTREGRLPPDEARRMLAEVADALDYASRKGVVHRDVKPDNILIEAGTGRAYLTDFGVAKQHAPGRTLTQTGMVVGTPHYMSPEQASASGDIDGRSDLYALGVIGYRMLSGRLPFESGSLQELLTQHITREPIPITVAAAGVPPDLAAVVSRCLKKDPAERWISGAHVRSALSSGDDIVLPDEISDFPSRGTKLAAWNYGVFLASLALYRLDGDGIWLGFAGSMAAFSSFLLGVWFITGKRHGLPWRRVLKLLFWAPESWVGWWPGSLRRPGDVWPRLPRWLRVLKAGITLFGVSTAALPVVVLAIMQGWASWFFFAFSAGVIGGGIHYSVVEWREKKRHALTTREFMKLINERTWKNPFWQRPDVARLLETPVSRISAADPRTPLEYVQAIEQLVQTIGGDMQPLGRESAIAARDLLLFIGAIDAELADLSRDADPVELGRLEQKLSSLGAAGPDEPQARKQMRSLVVSQIKLLDQLERRRRELADDREPCVALLRNLWLQVAGLRAQAVRDSMSITEISGRIRALCDDVARERVAKTEVERLIAPATPSGNPV